MVLRCPAVRHRGASALAILPKLLNFGPRRDVDFLLLHIAVIRDALHLYYTYLAPISSIVFDLTIALASLIL